jgi:hypothetical protein
VIAAFALLLWAELNLGSDADPASDGRFRAQAQVPASQQGLTVLHKTVGQRVPSRTLTVITWNSERTDALSSHSGSSSQIVIKDPGVYSVDAHGAWSANGSGNRYQHLELDCADSAPRIVSAASRAALDESSHQLHWEGEITQAMTPCSFSVAVYQNSGSDRYYGGPDGSTTGRPWARPLASGDVSVNVEFSAIRRVAE